MWTVIRVIIVLAAIKPAFGIIHLFDYSGYDSWHSDTDEGSTKLMFGLLSSLESSSTSSSSSSSTSSSTSSSSTPLLQVQTQTRSEEESEEQSQSQSEQPEFRQWPMKRFMRSILKSLYEETLPRLEKWLEPRQEKPQQSQEETKEQSHEQPPSEDQTRSQQSTKQPQEQQQLEKRVEEGSLQPRQEEARKYKEEKLSPKYRIKVHLRAQPERRPQISSQTRLSKQRLKEQSSELESREKTSEDQSQELTEELQSQLPEQSQEQSQQRIREEPEARSRVQPREKSRKQPSFRYGYELRLDPQSLEIPMEKATMSQVRERELSEEQQPREQLQEQSFEQPTSREKSRAVLRPQTHSRIRSESRPLAQLLEQLVDMPQPQQRSQEQLREAQQPEHKTLSPFNPQWHQENENESVEITENVSSERTEESEEIVSMELTKTFEQINSRDREESSEIDLKIVKSEDTNPSDITDFTFPKKLKPFEGEMEDHETSIADSFEYHGSNHDRDITTTENVRTIDISSKPSLAEGMFQTDTKIPDIEITIEERKNTKSSTNRMPFTPGKEETLEEPCHEEGFFSNPKNCSKFYRCVAIGFTFVKYEFSCPLETIWDDRLQTCNFPDNIERVKQCKRKIYHVTPANAKANNLLATCNSTMDDRSTIVCPSGFRRYSKYCNVFYQCTINDGIELNFIPFLCPKRSIFNEEEMRCVRNERDDCAYFQPDEKFPPITVVNVSDRKLCPREGQFIYGELCSNKYLKCDRNERGALQGYLLDCPNGQLGTNYIRNGSRLASSFGRYENYGKFCKYRSRVAFWLKEQSSQVAEACARQFEFIAAQRIRRTLQLFHLYTRIWDEIALKEFMRTWKRSTLRNAKHFLTSSIGITMYNWDRERISEEELKSYKQEIKGINKLKETTVVCAKCHRRIVIDTRQPGIDYCTCYNDKFNATVNQDPCSVLADGWRPYIERQDMIIWRREEPNFGGLFAYKVYGSFSDVTAEDFLQAQIDLDYRTKWDPTAREIRVIDTDPKSSKTVDNGSDIIYWETIWPRLFTNRDYVYQRRWLVDKEKRLIVIISRVTEHPSAPTRPGTYRVTTYWSYMVIKSYTELHQPGIEFGLTYFDDPGVNVPSAITSWVAMSGLPDFLIRMREASKNYQSYKITKEDTNISDTGYISSGDEITYEHNVENSGTQGDKKSETLKENDDKKCDFVDEIETLTLIETQSDPSDEDTANTENSTNEGRGLLRSLFLIKLFVSPIIAMYLK